MADVETKEGLRFLVCSHCGGTLALLDEQLPPKINNDFIGFSGMLTTFTVSSGVMYSGYPVPEQIMYT